MSALRIGMGAVLVYGWLGFLGMSVAARADDVYPVPGLVDLGFSDFRSAGFGKAFATWSFDGPLAQDANWNKRLNASAPFWSSLGRCLGYDNVQTQALSQRTTAVTLTAQFEKAEVFFRFIVFQTGSRATVTAIEWTTDLALWE